MIRVLHCVNNMDRAGLETMLMNYYRNIDRNQIQFDFLMHREERSAYDDEIEALGGRIFRAPRLYPQNYPAYFKYMKGFFKAHPEYTIVHSHIDAMSYLPLKAAKKAGVPVRIAHSHSTGIDLDLKYPLKQIFRYRLIGVANQYFSCGNDAGKFLFRGKPFTVIANAVDSKKFEFDRNLREDTRAELGVSDKFVVGHVGRMSYPKNHSFLLRVFAELVKIKPESHLLLVGTGEKEAELKKLATDLGIFDSISFLGSRDDVYKFYQAMDIFVMPSHFEGIPLVGIEAQFAGLPCLFSDGVPREVGFSKLCRFQKLSAPISTWVEDVVLCASEADRKHSVENSNYDIRSAVVALEKRYVNFMTANAN